MNFDFRTLFGGSVGPNRKQMPDGSVQYHYDGIQVRKVPLPLRVPLQAQVCQKTVNFILVLYYLIIILFSSHNNKIKIKPSRKLLSRPFCL